ncbi:MAG: hypothetical protein ACQES9_12920 [Myxococcota bacterium]
MTTFAYEDHEGKVKAQDEAHDRQAEAHDEAHDNQAEAHEGKGEVHESLAEKILSHNPGGEDKNS